MLLSSISLALTRLGQQLGRWSPLALWPDGVDSPGMWSSPSTLPASFNDYTGTTPVATPGTVADSSNPVGLAYDLRAGTPVLGPDAVVNGDFSDGTTGWSITGGNWSVAGGAMQHTPGAPSFFQQTRATLPLGAGKWFELVYTVSGRTAGGFTLYFAGYSFYGFDSNGTKSIIYNDTGGSYVLLFDATADYDGAIDNISVKEVPGNHMLQSTSAARPLLSSRVNLARYTGDLSGWNKDAGVTVTPNYGPAPDSTSTSIRVQFDGANEQVFLNNLNGGGNPGILSLWMKGVSGETLQVVPDFSYPYAVTFTGAWQQVEKYSAIANAFSINTYVSSTARDVEVWHPQLQRGDTVTDYQAILTDGSTYPSTDFPIAQLYDGVDDGMATAAFAAGTLIDGMDCMIAVRRDSAASCVAGLYNGVADATKFFGMAESASGSGCVGSGAGTPTVWVDNTQLTGGTAVTRGTLHTALTVGDWHILEFRNLDLSTWTAAGFGLYTSYVFPGPRGDILLYPSTTPTEDKDAARQWLADYYGVTLP